MSDKTVFLLFFRINIVRMQVIFYFLNINTSRSMCNNFCDTYAKDKVICDKKKPLIKLIR